LSQGDLISINAILNELNCTNDCFYERQNGCVGGIKCENGFIKEINLSERKMGGVIGEALLSLSFSLEVLDLFDGGLVGTLPSTLATFSRLKHLDLSANRISGTLPAFPPFSTFLSVLFVFVIFYYFLC
jgi:hypothetical protein